MKALFLALAVALLCACGGSDGSSDMGSAAGGFPAYVPPRPPAFPAQWPGAPAPCAASNTSDYTFEQGWVACTTGDPVCGFNGWEPDAGWPVHPGDAKILCTCDVQKGFYGCVMTDWKISDPGDFASILQIDL